MPEKWTPKSAVLSARRLATRNLLTKRLPSHYISGNSIEVHTKQPPMDSIWEWNKSAVEDIPHIS